MMIKKTNYWDEAKAQELFKTGAKDALILYSRPLVTGLVNNGRERPWFRFERREDLISVGLIAIATELAKSPTEYNGKSTLYSFLTIVAKYTIYNYLRKKDQRIIYHPSLNDLEHEPIKSTTTTIEYQSTINRLDLASNLRQTEAYLFYPDFGEWLINNLSRYSTLAEVKTDPFVIKNKKEFLQFIAKLREEKEFILS